MRTITKRLSAFILCLILLCGTVPMTAFAMFSGNGLNNGTYSSDPGQYVANIALANEGRSGSSLGYTYDWCAAFVSDCAEKAGQGKAIPPRTFVYEIKDVLLGNGGYTVSASNARPGDVCIIDWSGNKTSSSHVEIVYAVSGSSVYTIGGNTGGGDSFYTRRVAKHAPLSNSYIVCIIRPAYNGSINNDIPHPVTDLKSNKKVYNTHESINFSWTPAAYASNYWVYLWKDGVQLYSYNCGSSTSFTQAPSSEGKYTLVIRPGNAFGFNESSTPYSFIVTNKVPDPVLDLSSDKKVYNTSESIYFFWSQVETATEYYVYLWKNGEQLYSYNCGSSCTFTQAPSTEGKYTLIIRPGNVNGFNESSPWYTFEVKNTTHTHSYTSKVTKAATCTANGVRTYTCSCGDSYTESIAALGHSYKSVVTPPTCTAQGYTTFTCTRSGCGYSYKSNYTNAKGHTPGEWKITKEPTITSTGSKTLYCRDCGQAVKTETIPKLVQPQSKVHSVAINDMELNYKQTGSLNPVITADSGASYKVSYTSSNSDIASVDNNGNIYAAKRGSAKITVTVTDSYGNSVTDDCIVNVDYSGLQWFIIIVLFGWIWYI